MKWTFAVAVALGFALAASRAATADIDPSKAWVKEKQGVRILHLAGTPYEMGMQQGTLLRDEVRDLVGTLWLAPIQELLGDNMPMAREVVARVAKFCPGYVMEEMRGIAKGAGVPEQDVIFATLIADQLEYYGRTGRFGAKLSALPVGGGGSAADAARGGLRLAAEPAVMGCSNFACFGRATKTGETYHGVNFDWAKDLGLQKHYLVIAREPANGKPFVTIGWAGTLYTTATMNANRITTGFVGARTANSSNMGLPMGLMHRRVAQEASSIADAVAIISSVPRTPYGINYVISDAKVPEAAAVETDSKFVAVWKANDPREKDVSYAIALTDAVVRSDEAMDGRIRDAQTCSNGDPAKPGLEDPRGTESYDHRYKGLADSVRANFGRLDDATALAMIRAAHMEGANMHSVLWCPTRLEFYLATARGDQDGADGTYVHFTWAELFPGK